ncbi:MAG: hypothetical protein MI919_29575 [Holophagales bacterium]|nr:hypothetical protein [Holophagales bacterium]
MTKFDIRHWSDFVRGVADPEIEAEMEQYLESGTKSSNRERSLREVAALRRVMQLAETDRRLGPPARSVRWVKALGSLRRPEAAEESSVGSLDRMLLALRFDSWRAAEAGVRDFGHGMQHRDREVRYEGNEFLVDLRIESVAGRVSIVGQLMRDPEEAEPLAGVPVFFVAGERVLGSCLTGELGELQAEDLVPEVSEVRFVLEDGRNLEIRLPEARPAAAAPPRTPPSQP